MTVGETLAVTSSISGGSLAISGSSIAGDVDFDGAITRDGGTVDTNGVLNQASIAGAIASAKLTSVVTGASVGSATVKLSFNDKGQITNATTTSVAGVSELHMTLLIKI